MSNQINLADVLPTMEQALEAATCNAGRPFFGPCEQNGRLYVFGCYRENGETRLIPHCDEHGNITSFPLSKRQAARRFCERLNRAVAQAQPVTCVAGSTAWQKLCSL